MSVYISTFIIRHSILQHSENDHNVIKPDKMVFLRGWQTVPEYSIHFLVQKKKKPGEIWSQQVWHVDFLILFYLIKEELLAQ